MQAIQGVYDGKTIRPLEPIRAQPNVRVIITFIEADPIDGLPTTRLQEVAGCLHYPGPAKTMIDMEDAIRKGVEEHWK